VRSLVLLSILAAGLLAAVHLDLTPSRLVPNEGGLALAGEFFSCAFSPALVSESGSGRSLLPSVLEGLRATVLFAAAGMSLALVLGMVLGFFASTAWWSGDIVGGQGPVARILRRSVWPAVYAAARVVAAFLRSIHELFWALLLLAAFGLSNFSAVIAIALPYGGTLAKVFSEMVDEAPRESALALRGAGASPLQVFTFGLLPRALPDMAAYAFYRFECALRSSAILGFFGYPTLGYFLAASFENVYFGEVWTYLYALFLLVALVDWWSGALRRRVVVA
jgi:phosphonate transport system permease protein